MYWTKSLRKGSLHRMNHMAITWWASDTIYWLNLEFVKKNKQTKKNNKVKEHSSIWEYTLVVYRRLLGRVGIGEGDGKHADILLGYKIGVQMRQAHQGY